MPFLIMELPVLAMDDDGRKIKNMEKKQTFITEHNIAELSFKYLYNILIVISCVTLKVGGDSIH